MKFSIDETVRQLTQDMMPDPWDLQLTIGEEDFRVRPLTPGDIARLRQVEGGQLPEPDVRRIILELFEDPKPREGELTGDRLTAILVRVVGYQQGRLSKNLQAVVAQTAAAAMARR